jgi:methylmalonyl-CoA/ethylmalonyl-CoA epimerase
MVPASRNTLLGPIGQIALTVHDLERAKRFYRDTLGMRHLFDAPPGMSFFDAGGIRLLLGLAEEGKENHYSSVLYYQVGDIRAVAHTLLERGVKFKEQPALVAKLPDHELWIASFEDSEGNAVALMSEVR